MSDNSLVTQSGNSQRVSLREQSNSTLQAAIHSQHDAGETLERVNQVLAAYFDPHLDDPKTRAGVREEFVRALAGRPMWAIHRAFDAWSRTRVRRPSPGEIVTLGSLKMVSQMGFEGEARIRFAAHDGSDILVMKMYREKCRWIRHGQGQQTAGGTGPARDGGGGITV